MKLTRWVLGSVKRWPPPAWEEPPLYTGSDERLSSACSIRRSETRRTELHSGWGTPAPEICTQKNTLLDMMCKL